MKRSALLAVVLLLPTLSSHAQVAAPGLLPFANPATLAWEFSPVIMSSLLVVDQSASRNSQSAPDREGDGSGILVRGRRPGKSVALGFQLLDAGVELGNSDVGATKQGLRTYALGIATRVGENIALGTGVESIEEREASVNSDLDLGTSTILAGASLRLAGVFYLATVHGRRRLNSNIVQHDGQGRNMSRVAVGLRWFNSTMLVHAEYSREDSPPFREVSFSALPGFTFDVMDTRVNTVVAEIVVKGVFIGYTTADTITLGHPLKNETIRTEFATIGFMPKSGLIVTLTNRVEETEDRVKDTNERLEVLALGIAWRF